MILRNLTFVYEGGGVIHKSPHRKNITKTATAPNILFVIRLWLIKFPICSWLDLHIPSNNQTFQELPLFFSIRLKIKKPVPKSYPFESSDKLVSESYLSIVQLVPMNDLSSDRVKASGQSFRVFIVVKVFFLSPSLTVPFDQ